VVKDFVSKYMKFVALFMLCCLSIPAAMSHEETEKIKRLEITIEQLSTQLAEKTAENKRLSAAMANALSAERSNTRVVVGCDTTKIEKQVAFSSGASRKERKFVELLKSHAEQCTKPQLETLRRLANSMVYRSETIPIIDFYLKN
jgi:hypothetical protein